VTLYSAILNYCTYLGLLVPTYAHPLSQYFSQRRIMEIAVDELASGQGDFATIRRLLGSCQHCMGCWRLGHPCAALAFLDAAAECDGGHPYDGRNWFSGPGPCFEAPWFDAEDEEATAGPTTGAAATAWWSVQYSFPLRQLEAVVSALKVACPQHDHLREVLLSDCHYESFVSSTESGGGAKSTTAVPTRDRGICMLYGRVVEFKFLRASTAAMLGANSVVGCSAAGGEAASGCTPVSCGAGRDSLEGYFCVNAYWEDAVSATGTSCCGDGPIGALENALSNIRGGRPHWGKVHSRCPATTGVGEAESEEQKLLSGWLGNFPEARTFRSVVRAADPEGLFFS